MDQNWVFTTEGLQMVTLLKENVQFNKYIIWHKQTEIMVFKLNVVVFADGTFCLSAVKPWYILVTNLSVIRNLAARLALHCNFKRASWIFRAPKETAANSGCLAFLRWWMSLPPSLTLLVLLRLQLSSGHVVVEESENNALQVEVRSFRGWTPPISSAHFKFE